MKENEMLSRRYLLAEGSKDFWEFKKWYRLIIIL